MKRTPVLLGVLIASLLVISGGVIALAAANGQGGSPEDLGPGIQGEVSEGATPEPAPTAAITAEEPVSETLDDSSQEASTEEAVATQEATTTSNSTSVTYSDDSDDSYTGGSYSDDDGDDGGDDDGGDDD